MLKSGICSLTLGKLTVEEVINTVKKANLIAIEWWGKNHIPHGDIETAQRVGNLTREVGLEISGYGSYYRVGVSEDFDDVLATATALKAPSIRVWAGNCNYENATEVQISSIVNDSMRIANLAQEQGITITFEFHINTLTNTNESTILFMNMVKHDNIFFSWQPPMDKSFEYSRDGLLAVLPRLSTLHVFHWVFEDGVKYKLPLIDGENLWMEYLKIAQNDKNDHYALMEFVKDDDINQFFEDAKVLRNLLS